MKVSGDFIFTEDYESDKTGKYYLTLADRDTGGTVQISADKVPADWEKFKPMTLEMEVNPRRDRAGGSYLDLIKIKSAGGK